MPYLQPKWPKPIPYLLPKGPKNRTLWGCTYLYSPYKGVPPPRAYTAYTWNQFLYVTMLYCQLPEEINNLLAPKDERYVRYEMLENN